MKRIPTIFSLILIAGMLFFAQMPARAQIVVIVHKSTAVKSGSDNIARLLDIFMLNTQQWEDGTRIRVVDVKGDNSLKTRFYKFLSVTLADVQRVWLRKQFSGKATPPLALQSEEEIVQKVASTPGAIGYVSADKVTADVKVIATLK